MFLIDKVYSKLAIEAVLGFGIGGFRRKHSLRKRMLIEVERDKWSFKNLRDPRLLEPLSPKKFAEVLGVIPEGASSVWIYKRTRNVEITANQLAWGLKRQGFLRVCEDGKYILRTQEEEMDLYSRVKQLGETPISKLEDEIALLQADISRGRVKYEPFFLA